jgi:hypothetical protein
MPAKLAPQASEGRFTIGTEAALVDLLQRNQIGVELEHGGDNGIGIRPARTPDEAMHVPAQRPHTP